MANLLFIEVLIEAVCNYIWELTIRQIKVENKNINEVDLNKVIDEAVEWSRNQ